MGIKKSPTALRAAGLSLRLLSESCNCRNSQRKSEGQPRPNKPAPQSFQNLFLEKAKDKQCPSKQKTLKNKAPRSCPSQIFYHLIHSNTCLSKIKNQPQGKQNTLRLVGCNYFQMLLLFSVAVAVAVLGFGVKFKQRLG